VSRPPSVWSRLGIAATKDERAIKTAYVLRLKAIDVDSDPAGFIALRQARDLALAQARRAVAPARLDEVQVSASDLAEGEISGPVQLRAIQGRLVQGRPIQPVVQPEQPRVNQAHLARLSELLSQPADTSPPEELLAVTDLVLTDPALDQVDRGREIESWLAGVIVRTIPRSDIINRRVSERFQWLKQASALRQEPAVRAVLQRQVDLEFLNALTGGHHRWRASYHLLKRPPPKWWRIMNTDQTDQLRLLFNTLRRDHRALLGDCNADTLAWCAERFDRKPLIVRFWAFCGRKLPGGPALWDVQPRLRLTPYGIARLMIFPYVGVWILFRDGISARARIIGFGWLLIWTLICISVLHAAG